MPPVEAASATALPGAIRALLGGAVDDASLHDVYDEIGAPIYDDLCRRDPHEVRELLALTRGLPGDLLDLAAGAGRLTLPLLASGRRVVALELSPTMVALLHARLLDAPGRMRDRCTVLLGDMREFDIGQEFGAAVLGTTSISLLDEQGRSQLYERVLAHLGPGGRFLVSTVDLAAGAGGTDLVREVSGHSGRTYRMAESLSDDGTTRTVAIMPTATGREPLVVCASVVQVVPLADLTTELARHGFVVRDVHEVTSGDDRYRDVLVEAQAG